MRRRREGLSGAAAPAISVVLVTPDRYERLRETIQHLRKQTVSARLEIVIAAPSLANLNADERDLSDFASFRFVETGPILNTGEPRAVGARAARAPIVAFGEDHCWPEPTWAAALIEAHKQPWAGVGPTLRNGNPESVVSWASFLLNFGAVAECTASGMRRNIPTHNSSYKASLLRAYGNELGSMLEAEGLMQKDIVGSGRELFLQSGARCAHINISSFPSFVWEQFWGARLFWATRVEHEHWSLLRCFAWSAATPGLMLLRFQRALRNASRARFPSARLPSLFCILLAGAVSLSGGACAGILMGRGPRSVGTRVSIEFHRCLYLRPQDKHLLPDD